MALLVLWICLIRLCIVRPKVIKKVFSNDQSVFLNMYCDHVKCRWVLVPWGYNCLNKPLQLKLKGIQCIRSLHSLAWMASRLWRKLLPQFLTAYKETCYAWLITCVDVSDILVLWHGSQSEELCAFGHVCSAVVVKYVHLPDWIW